VQVAFLAALLASSVPQDAVAKYVLVVHAENPCRDDAATAKALIKRLYLKDLTAWADGTEARPYAREATAAEQVAFLKDVVGMTEAELARHWLRLKNTDGTTPPKAAESERLLLKHIARHRGAFGVVRKEAVAGAEGVRVLFEF
jgi:hypothetical protein